MYILKVCKNIVRGTDLIRSLPKGGLGRTPSAPVLADSRMESYVLCGFRNRSPLLGSKLGKLLNV